MRCLTGFAIYMWLLVVSRSSDYWLGISPRVILIALVEVKVCLGIPSCGTRWVPRGSRGLILGSTGRGCPLLYPASVFPTYGHEKPTDPVCDNICTIFIIMFTDCPVLWISTL